MCETLWSGGASYRAWSAQYCAIAWESWVRRHAWHSPAAKRRPRMFRGHRRPSQLEVWLLLPVELGGGRWEPLPGRKKVTSLVF